MEIAPVIEHFIITEILLGRKKRIDPDESLINTGILDSLTLLQLIAFIEERFDVTVGDGDMIPDNFQTINCLKAFLERKKQNS